MCKLFKQYLIVAMIFTMSLTAIVNVKTAEAVPVTDMVFMIDATGSMQAEIVKVRAGFTDFVADLTAASVDARFAVVVYGDEPELILDFTSDVVATQAALDSITVGVAVPGVINNHNNNPEAGLETIRMVLGAAVENEFVNNNIPEDGFLDFRANARKNLMIMTDEDSDLPVHVLNRFGDQTGTQGTFGGPPNPPDPFNASWQAEVDATAQAIIDNDAFINMLINPFDEFDVDPGSTKKQYGDHNKDVNTGLGLLGFDPAATLANLLADPDTANSLQAQVLGADLTARSFYIENANDIDFVANFFDSKVEEIVGPPNGDPPNGDPIPEPGTVILMGIGLVGLAGGAARRKWKKKVVNKSQAK